MSQILTVAASSNGSSTVDFIPQFLIIDFGAAGVVDSLQVSAKGLGTIVDLDGDGIKALASMQVQTAIGTTGVAIPIMLADGYINKTMDVRMTTGAGNDVTVYGTSLRKGAFIVRSTRQTVLANTAGKFKDFLGLAIAVDSSDRYTFATRFGSNDDVSAAELVALGSIKSNNTTPWTPIDNKSQIYKYLQIIPSANRTVYVQQIDKGVEEIDRGTKAQLSAAMRPVLKVRR